MPQAKGTGQSALTLIALGSNQSSAAGSPVDTLHAAIARLEVTLGPLISSTIYRTPAFPDNSGPDFANAVCAMQCEEDPRTILEILHQIEAEFHRDRTTRWGQRTLDLDLLARGAKVCPNLETFNVWKDLLPEVQSTRAPDQLILPHPRIQDRAFVLVPLAEIAPDWIHPVLQKSALDLCEALDPALKSTVVPHP